MDQQPEIILQLQANVLERIAVGARLEETLRELCALVEGIVPESICSSMLLAPDGTLRVAAAPRASEELIEALNGLVPSDLAGSCGTAVYQRQAIFVGDTSCDPRWSQFRDLARKFKIEACWSVPIFSRQQAVLGSFAISHLEPREPTAFDKQILKTASQLAGIAVERNISEKAVQQAQKLESLGVLAGGIAHDFNNLLVGILGNAHLAISQIEPGSSASEPIGEIRKASERAADLIKQLLAYAGRGKVSIETVDLCTMMKEMAELLRSSVPRKIELECSFPDESLWVDADVTQLRQVGMNLVTNAADSIGSGAGIVSVHSGVMTADRTYLSKCQAGDHLPPGDYNYMQIRDTGCGMDEEMMGKIFDPFFTTKANGRGLGLAATLGIVKAHGGALSIDTGPDAGTTFRVLFPRARADADVADRDERPRGECRGAPATILVVDDEEMVLNVTKQMLEHIGYHVLTAGSGRDAVTLARELGDELDLVVLDATMPGMDGEETFRALRKLRTDLPVAFCSGHGPVDGAALVAGRRRTAFIAKPFSPETLYRTVARLLPAEVGVVANR